MTGKFLRFGVTMEMMTHREEQRGDGSAAFKMNHGQEAGQVTLSGSGKEQSTRDDIIVAVEWEMAYKHFIMHS